MSEGIGLSKHDLAMHLSRTTGTSYENATMDLNRVSDGPLWADRSRISERAFGEFARSKGMTDWDAAGVVNDINRVGLENALHQVAGGNIPQLSAFSLGSAGRSPLRDIMPPLGRLAARSTSGGVNGSRQRTQNSNGAELLRTVMDNATSGDSERRRLRRDALRSLGDLGSSYELVQIVERFATSGDSDARETRRMALEMLGPESASSLLSLVMSYATSGDSDARETRRAALNKLGQFGCSHELRRIADSLANSGDSDAKETRRSALDML